MAELKLRPNNMVSTVMLAAQPALARDRTAAESRCGGTPTSHAAARSGVTKRNYGAALTRSSIPGRSCWPESTRTWSATARDRRFPLGARPDHRPSPRRTSTGLDT